MKVRIIFSHIFIYTLYLLSRTFSFSLSLSLFLSVSFSFYIYKHKHTHNFFRLGPKTEIDTSHGESIHENVSLPLASTSSYVPPSFIDITPPPATLSATINTPAPAIVDNAAVIEYMEIPFEKVTICIYAGSLNTMAMLSHM